MKGVENDEDDGAHISRLDPPIELRRSVMSLLDVLDVGFDIHVFIVVAVVLGVDVLVLGCRVFLVAERMKAAVEVKDV